MKVDQAELERKADAARARLVRAVEALDRRRRQVVRLGTQAKQLAVPAAVSVAVVAALFGASILVFGMAWRERRRRSLRYRAKNTLRELQFSRPSIGRVVAEKVASSLAALLATELGRRVSKNFIDGRYPSGRLALPVRPVEAAAGVPPGP
jgi:hypothetical protein